MNDDNNNNDEGSFWGTTTGYMVLISLVCIFWIVVTGLFGPQR
jgi:hypothetical protein